jgi:ribosomal-protein-alanine N-acetyltransferase
MEKMLFHAHGEVREPLIAVQPAAPRPADWRFELPQLVGNLVMLRELQIDDAPALFAALKSDQVTRFLTPPPSTVEGFAHFITWARRQREAGQFVCFAIVPHGSDTPVGLFQVRSLEPAFGTAEWGFALASEFWGKGIFLDGAQLVINFAFDVLGTFRLEARAAVKNGRGNGALRKLGAVQEGMLRRSFMRNGEYLDQVLWTILRDEWYHVRAIWGNRIVH